MKAFAYAETHSRGNYSNEPTTHYVLRFSLLSALGNGIGSISTTDYSKFGQALREEAAKGTEITSSRLPLFLRSNPQKAVDEPTYDFEPETPPLKATITRVPLDEILRSFSLPAKSD